MRPVYNNIPHYQRKHPIGTRVRWYDKDIPREGSLVVAGYSRCTNDECQDCDKVQYMMHGETYPRCHYRNPESRFGLCFWEAE